MSNVDNLSYVKYETPEAAKVGGGDGPHRARNGALRAFDVTVYILPWNDFNFHGDRYGCKTFAGNALDPGEQVKYDAKKLDYYHELEREHGRLVMLADAERGMKDALAGRLTSAADFRKELDERAEKRRAETRK